MEILTLVRGNWDDVEKFKREMSSKYLDWKDGKTWTGNDPNKDWLLPIRVTPYEIIGFAFPKDQLDVILNTIQNKKGFKWMIKSKYGWLRKYVNVLQKLLKLKPIPDWDEKAKKLIVYRDNVEVWPIGIKEDIIMDGQNGKKTEGI